MTHSFLFFLVAGCAGAVSSDPGASVATEAALGVRSSSALECAALVAEGQAQIDDALVARAITGLGLQNLGAMQGLALESASEVASGSAREAADLQYDARLAELAQEGLLFPALDPAALGLDDTSLAHPAEAAEAYELLGTALDTVAAEWTRLHVAVGEAMRAAERGRAELPRCEAELFVVVEAMPDNADRIDLARVVNVAEARAFAAATITAEEEVLLVLRYMRDTAVASASETIGDDVRQSYQASFLAQAAEINRIAYTASYNEQPVAMGTRRRVEVYLGSEQGQQLYIPLANLTAPALGVDTGSLDMSTASGASAAIDSIDNALATVTYRLAQVEAVDTALSIEATRYGN